jgi:general stress protein 26
MGITLVSMLLVAAPVFSADERALQAARAIMEASAYCFLITVDAAGQPQARMMEPFAPQPDMTIWFGTHPRTRKVAEIRKNPRATVAYSDPQGAGYVTLLGTARIVDDADERRRHWKENWDEFFPGGPAGRNFTLIEFKPSRIELISVSREIVTKPGEPPVILVRKGSEWVPASAK